MFKIRMPEIKPFWQPLIIFSIGAVFLTPIAYFVFGFETAWHLLIALAACCSGPYIFFGLVKLVAYFVDTRPPLRP